MIDDKPVDSTIVKLFHTFDSNDPAASVAIAAFVLGDIQIYKDGGTTKRSSTAGIVLLDTDGIDFASQVGIGGFSIDLSDDTDSGFYAADSSYSVVIGPVTVDAGVVNWVAYEFTIEIAGGAIALTKALVATVGVAGAGLGDLGGMSTAMIAEVNAACDASIETYHLDHLLAADAADIPVDGSVIAQMVSTTEDWSTFVPSTDSLQSVRDKLTDIETDTAEIGTAGVGLTNVKLPEDGLDLILKTSTHSLAVADAVWDEVLTGATHNINNSAGKRLRTIDAAFEVQSGTAQAGAAATITLESGASTVDNIYNGDRVVITAGTGVGEHGLILGYVGSTLVATMSKNWVVQPDNTSEYTVVPADCDVELWNDVSVTGDGDWAAQKAETVLILADTSDIQPKIGTIPALDGAGQTIGAAIAKLADDNGGADFDAGTDSLQELRDHIGDGTSLVEAGGDGDHLTAIPEVALVTTTTTNTDMRGTDNAATSAKQDTMETTLNDVPTTGEFNARTIVAASYFDPTTDAVANVTLVATTTNSTQAEADIAALNDISIAEVNTQVDTGLSDIGLQYLVNTALPTGWATDVTADSVVDYMADDGTAVYDRTTDSLQALADSGGGGPTAVQIADQVWEEAIADHSGTSGSTAEALAAAGGAGDPWITTLPGSYGAGTAGEILGDWKNAGRLDTILDSVLADTGELQTDDVPGLIAALNDAPAVTAADNADAVWDEALAGHVIAGSYGKAVADIETDAAAILVDTADLQANQGSWLTATGFATNTKQDTMETTLDAAATAAALATVDGNVDDLKLGTIYGTAVTGTLAVGSCTTDLTGYGDDQLIGRVIIFTPGGVADGEGAVILDYASTSGLVTFETDLTIAPENTDPFKIV